MKYTLVDKIDGIYMNSVDIEDFCNRMNYVYYYNAPENAYYIYKKEED